MDYHHLNGGDKLVTILTFMQQLYDFYVLCSSVLTFYTTTIDC